MWSEGDAGAPRYASQGVFTLAVRLFWRTASGTSEYGQFMQGVDAVPLSFHSP